MGFINKRHSCLFCIHKPVCDAYEQKGITDFKQGDISPCLLFTDKTKFLAIPCAVNGAVYRLTKRIEKNGAVKKTLYEITKVIISSELEALRIKKYWGKRYFSSPREAEHACFKERTK